jgi:hypothetical protein
MRLERILKDEVQEVFARLDGHTRVLSRGAGEASLP